jgi:homoserine kinase
MALAIYNRARVTAVDGPFVIHTTGEGASALPTDRTNLFFEAASRLAALVGRPLPGMRVDMAIEVPLVRGLGSSSTAIVGGILAANRLLGDPLDADGLLDLATEIEGHPDNVSPCLRGGVTVSAVDGGRVCCVRALPPPGLQVVVAVPDFQVKTRDARDALPAAIPHADAVYNVGRACLVTAALMSGRLDALALAMDDRLHQPYRARLVPGFHDVLAAARDAGALGAALSGAGPTILAFASEDPAAVASAMASAWQRHGVAARAFPLDIDCEGARLE